MILLQKRKQNKIELVARPAMDLNALGRAQVTVHGHDPLVALAGARTPVLLTLQPDYFWNYHLLHGSFGPPLRVKCSGTTTAINITVF